MALFQKIFCVETQEDGNWIELDSLFAFMKQNYKPDDKVKDVRRNMILKEVKKYKDSVKTVISRRESCNYISVCAALTYILKHAKHYQCCKELAHDVEQAVVTPERKNKDFENMTLFQKIFCVETQEDGNWIELDSLFAFMKQNYKPDDKVKDVRRNMILKEVKKYKDSVKTVISRRESCNYISVCAALTYILKHTKHYQCCKELASDVEQTVLSPQRKRQEYEHKSPPFSALSMDYVRYDNLQLNLVAFQL